MMIYNFDDGYPLAIGAFKEASELEILSTAVLIH